MHMDAGSCFRSFRGKAAICMMVPYKIRLSPISAPLQAHERAIVEVIESCVTTLDAAILIQQYQVTRYW